MQKHFNKELAMTKEENEDFKNSIKCCWIFVNYFDNVRDHCHINLKLNHKISFVFHNLKNYDSHLIMQELGKFNLKIHFVTNGLERYMNVTIKNKHFTLNEVSIKNFFL